MDIKRNSLITIPTTMQTVKSIQKVASYIPSGQSSADVTISSVDTTRCLVLFHPLPSYPVANTSNNYILGWSFTNATTFHVTGNASGSNTSFEFVIVEFY